MKHRAVLALVAVFTVLSPSFAFGMIGLDIDKELLLLKEGRSELHISGAQFRIAVFAFEDPDQTGLGNALARLLSHDILVNSRLRSIGVLWYSGGVSSPAPGALNYYDKVEVLTEAQQATIAVWGVVRRQGGRLIVDTYTQVPPHTLRKAFHWRFRLPRAMGGSELLVQLNPDRIFLQRLELTLAEGEQLKASAARLNELRKKDGDDQPVIATLPMDSVYFLQKRKQDWVLVNAGEERTGWVRARGYCAEACAPLLSASKFVSGLLAFIQSHRQPKVDPSLTDDAKAVRDQLLALRALDEAPPEISDREALQVIDHWFTPTATGFSVPPGGAAMANLRAVIEIVGALKRESLEQGISGGGPDDRAFDRLELDRAWVAGIADQLADASMIDPRNAIVLQNLSVLFHYVGDTARARLAESLAEDARTLSRAAGITQ